MIWTKNIFLTEKEKHNLGFQRIARAMLPLKSAVVH